MEQEKEKEKESRREGEGESKGEREEHGEGEGQCEGDKEEEQRKGEVVEVGEERRRTYRGRKTCRVQNPDIPRAGRYWAAPGGTAGPGGDGQHRTPTTGLFAKEKTNSLTPQTMEE